MQSAKLQILRLLLTGVLTALIAVPLSIWFQAPPYAVFAICTLVSVVVGISLDIHEIKALMKGKHDRSQ